LNKGVRFAISNENKHANKPPKIQKPVVRETETAGKISGIATEITKAKIIVNTIAFEIFCRRRLISATGLNDFLIPNSSSWE